VAEPDPQKAEQLVRESALHNEKVEAIGSLPASVVKLFGLRPGQLQLGGNHEVGQKRLNAILQRLAFRLCVAIGGDHDDRNARSQCLGLGNSSRPLIPGMLMSERIKMNDTLSHQ
jgi:hypothetical protein